jgi:ribosome biogenesis GTPase
VTTATGLVTATHRRHYAVVLDDGRALLCVLRGRARTIACGDRVTVDLAPNDEGVIIDILPRTTLCYRSDAHREKLIAANVTQILGIVAPDPPYDDELVHRWTIAAESSGCRFVVVANKSDLPGFAALEPRLAPLTALGYPVVRTSARDHARELAPRSSERSVLIGQSGTGKSTRSMHCCPTSRRIGEISASLQTASYHDANDSTRSTRTAGLSTLRACRIQTAPRQIHRVCFSGIRLLLGKCRFRNCRHDSNPDARCRKPLSGARSSHGESRPTATWRAEASAARGRA